MTPDFVPTVPERGSHFSYGTIAAYLAVVNHSEQPQDLTILSAIPVRSYTWITPEDLPEPVALEGAERKAPPWPV